VFTIYPPGHFPYGRSALAPVAPDGRSFRSAAAQAPSGGQASASPAQAFSKTIFDAALDAARGLPWKRAERLEGFADGCDRWWSTQQRHLARAMRLVGVAPGLTHDQRYQIAQVLSVKTLVLVEAANDLGRSPGPIARGKAVVKVLERIPHGAYLAERIAQSGFLASFWSEPLRWDLRRRGLLRKPFQPLRTRGPPPPG
jgi:hypothetical protein